MKRLLSWLTGALVMASLMAGLVMPSSVYADDDLRNKYSGNEIRNIADDKIAARDGKVDLNNSSVRRFQQFPGMYPTMAGKIVLGGPTTALMTCCLLTSPSGSRSCSRSTATTSPSPLPPSLSTKAMTASMTVNTVKP